ncbi:DUF5076 domain-containing protein [Enterovibrio norvegicus]|uniref:DUF5076 domain-containing protein n=1 Tax=Enterovibrio norvegicus TaxID=188144 RepID=UPI000C85B64F|nr:DUF5076 domain-containing protein [Enterovibrio norvegicus]PML75725.1 hypothetical protein BCT69_06220 [Enterovibrio norvegicus]PMN66661.1 hypothetical protein BCT27_24330 [Enterovibrio norvegicus]
MHELPIPTGTAGDDAAREMIRIWLAHDSLNVSLHLGMWEDAEDCDIDERDAWGELLADTVQHIANGMHQSHGWDKEQTIARITRSLIKHSKCPTGTITGNYVE